MGLSAWFILLSQSDQRIAQKPPRGHATPLLKHLPGIPADGASATCPALLYSLISTSPASKPLFIHIRVSAWSVFLHLNGQQSPTPISRAGLTDQL